MQLIDTHTHLYLPEFDPDRDEMIKRAVDSGVEKMLMPNIDVQSVDKMLSAAERFSGICFPMIGLHPTSVKEDYPAQLDSVEKLSRSHRFIAIGEIGIDLYWDKTFLKEQVDAFRRQIIYALEHSMPIVVHARDSFPEVFKVLDEFSGNGLTGVMHAFTGGIEEAEKAICLGFRLGIGGIVTFKNSGLEKTVEMAGLDNLILETDSPYLAPVPHRGKRNESSYIPLINNKIAEIFRISEEEAASVTYGNSVKLFNLE